ncbi:MAG: TIGR04086 family membrane protein [Clostridia bacterium]|nr:TIGR04086 family membrane protein [Clostridia bacterium]
MSYKTKTTSRKKRRPSEDADLFSVLCKNAAIGMIFSLLCAVALMLIGTFICLRSDDPLKLILPIGLVTLYLSALLGGIVTVRRNGKKALLSGALCGLFLFLFFLGSSLFFRGEGAFSFLVTLLFRLLTIFFSILGAFLGQKRATRRPHRKH